jgi:hypothetical protein
MPPFVFYSGEAFPAEVREATEQCEQNDRVLFSTLVKRRIKALNAQFEEDQEREKGNNDSFTQGRVNERATDAETKTLAR